MPARVKNKSAIMDYIYSTANRAQFYLQKKLVEEFRMINNKTTYTFPVPPGEAFTIIRDNQEEASERVSDVSSKKVVSREQIDDSTVKIVVRTSSSAKIPAIVRSAVKPEMLVWETEQIWDSATMVCTVHSNPIYFKNNVDVAGEWRFLPSNDGQQTQFVGTAKIVIDPAGVANISPQLAIAGVKLVEKFITKIMESAISKTMKAAEAYIIAKGLEENKHSKIAPDFWP